MKRFYTFVFFVFLVLVIYFPLLNKHFSSDDFSILCRVVYSPNGIFIKGFFRPLSDITLYANYLIGGFDPLTYNLFNLLAHAGCVYLVFQIARRVSWVPEEKRTAFSWLAALFFLAYPFHNESVVWIATRGSLVAALLGTGAVLVAVADGKKRWKYFLTCLLYFVGMSAYESILLLPVIILLAVYDRKLPLRSYFPWMAWLGATLFIHLVVRVLVSGVLIGEYGVALFSPSGLAYVSKVLKVAGRVFLPPMEHSNWLIILFLGLLIGLAAVTYLLWKRDRRIRGVFFNYLRVSGILLLALLIPLMFGLSTRTYEGDRVFYFPSVFWALWMAWMMVTLAKGRSRMLASVLVLTYESIFLIINIQNWDRAALIVRELIQEVKGKQTGQNHIYVINIPEEYEGVPVLRNGFKQALWLQDVDTSRVTAVNYVRTEQLRKEPDSLVMAGKGADLYIPPAVHISFTPGKNRDTLLQKAGGELMLQVNNDSTLLLYWNKQRFLSWKPESAGPNGH